MLHDTPAPAGFFSPSSPYPPGVACPRTSEEPALAQARVIPAEPALAEARGGNPFGAQPTSIVMMDPGSLLTQVPG